MVVDPFLLYTVLIVCIQKPNVSFFLSCAEYRHSHASTPFDDLCLLLITLT